MAEKSHSNGKKMKKKIAILLVGSMFFSGLPFVNSHTANEWQISAEDQSESGNVAVEDDNELPINPGEEKSTKAR